MTGASKLETPTRVRWALITGGVTASGIIVAYGIALAIRGRQDAIRAIAYNGPIAFVFLSVACELALRAVGVPFADFVRRHMVTFVVWAVGVLVLVLRLGTKSVEVSGHMAWLPLLAMQAHLHGFPRWFVGLAVASTAFALYLKLAVFGGPSGLPGTAVGLFLAAALWTASRLRRITRTDTPRAPGPGPSPGPSAGS